jgi:hypothetical protein
MDRSKQEARAAVIEQLIERFAPVNEAELRLAAREGELPAWVLVQRAMTGPAEILVLPLHRLAEIRRERLSRWLPIAVVGLDCDLIWTFAPEGGTTLISRDSFFRS